MTIILGSQSPRRRELLAGLDLPFESVSINADESFPSHLQGADIPLYIARAKAEAYRQQLQAEQLLITSDTIVWLEKQMLGKPKHEQEAREMLQMLSGKTHQVFTAVCFSWIEDNKWKTDTLADSTDVTFRKLTENEINYYVDRYHPTDKAGAYGIQEWIGYVGVTNLSGSYFNVMGFPVEKVYEWLRSHQCI